MDSLKASIGQGLINVFTPVLKLINTLLGKLSALASAFKSFTDMITGNKSSEESSVKTTSDELALSLIHIFTQKKNVFGAKELGGKYINGDWHYDINTKYSREAKIEASKISKYATERHYETFAEGFLAMDKGCLVYTSRCV